MKLENLNWILKFPILLFQYAIYYTLGASGCPYKTRLSPIYQINGSNNIPKTTRTPNKGNNKIGTI